MTGLISTAVAAFLRRNRRGGQRLSILPVDRRQELGDALPHVLWGTGADGRCEYLNERYTETFGIARAKAIEDQSWVEPIHPADRRKMYEAWRGAIESDSSHYSARARVRMNDGSYRWMESVGRSVRSPETGKVEKWFGTLIDVQDAIEDRETIARLQVDLQAITDECERTLGIADEQMRAVFETREIGWIEYEMGSARSIAAAFGIGDAEGFRSLLASHPSKADELRRQIRPSRASTSLARSLGYSGFGHLASTWQAMKGVRGLDVETTIIVALIGETPVTCGVAALPDAHGTLRRYPFSLWIGENGVARAAFFDTQTSDGRLATAGAARRELSRANRVATASALSSSLVHEISQPISAMSLDLATAARLIAGGASGTEAVERVMERLRWNTQRLSEIGTRTRDSLKPGRHNQRHVDVVELIRKSSELALPLSGSTLKAIAIVADSDIPLVTADPVALQQVIVALLENALEACEANPQAHISVAISRSDQANDLVVSVADSGPGIKPEHLVLAFDPFFSTKPNRLGFGLAVCQSVVEGFGGIMTLTNSAEGGAVARFSVPIETGKAQG